jgi:hypothetical protein
MSSRCCPNINKISNDESSSQCEFEHSTFEMHDVHTPPRTPIKQMSSSSTDHSALKKKNKIIKRMKQEIQEYIS